MFLCSLSLSHLLTTPSPRPVLHADFVSKDSGTGVVHMAPAHGEEDFEACGKAGIRLTPEQDLINDDGTFRPQAGEELAGMIMW